jgi:hypothetical protein
LGPLITLVSCPKAFHGHFATIQRNAITSWSRLEPTPEIILFGDDEGTAEICAELDLRFVPAVARNSSGTPLISDIFLQAQALAKHDLLCFANADIMLLSDFMHSATRLSQVDRRFLGIARRWNLDVTDPIDFHDPAWEASVGRLLDENGKPGWPWGLDAFVFQRGTYQELPPFAIGRPWWDNWMAWNARARGFDLIDLSPLTRLIHQNHDYSHHPDGFAGAYDGPEAVANMNWYKTSVGRGRPPDKRRRPRFAYSLDDATHVLTPNGVIPARRYRPRKWFTRTCRRWRLRMA